MDPAAFSSGDKPLAIVVFYFATVLVFAVVFTAAVVTVAEEAGATRGFM